MKKLFKIIVMSALLGSVVSCNCINKLNKSAVVEGTQVIAHRGYWDCKGSAQNSIHALKGAQKIGVYGSEFDANMTKDGILIINHDRTFKGLVIENTEYNILKDSTLKNGEKIPTLKQYLKQGKKSQKTKMIFELKAHSTPEIEKKAVEESVRMVKKYNLEKKTEFISFSMYICKEFARLMPNNEIAYLGGKIAPADLKKMGINAIDYHYSNFQLHPEWVKQAHDLGMKVNVWTVDNPEQIKEMINLGVDYITTNKPELVQSLIKH